MSRFINRTVEIIFWIFAAALLVCVALSGGSIVFGNYKLYLLAAILLVFCALFFVFGKDVYSFADRKLLAPVKNASVMTLAIVLGLVTLVTKLIFVLLLDNDANLHPDMQRYLAFANNIANDGKITDYVWYAYRHKRTAIYGMILAPFAWLFGSDTQALTSGLTILVAISNVLLFDIIRKKTGKNIAFVGLMIYNLMPVGLFQTQLLIHETALMFFHILSVWLMVKAAEKKFSVPVKLLFLVLSAVSIAIGKSVNPAGAVVVIALIIMTFIYIIKDRITLAKLAKFACLALAFLVVMSASEKVLTATVNTMIPEDASYHSISEKKVKNGWTIYLAFNYEHAGGWNEEDYTTYYAYEQIEDVEEAREYQTNLVKERLGEYLEDPLKIPSLFVRKFYILWGNMWMSISYQQGNHIESFLNNGMGKMIYVAMYLFSVMWYLIALTTILFARRKRRFQEPDDLVSPNIHFKMVILGVTAALLVSEVMAKYTSHLQILIFVIWLYELKDFCVTSGTVKEKLLGKLKKKDID